jgi:hypothetical protein
MKLTLIDENGVQAVEGEPGVAFMMSVNDVDRVIEACLSEGANAALLYAANLTPTFLDLSSGDAGAILQKMRNYSIRLAVVCPPGEVAFSTRFGEMVADEQRGTHFGIFETRQAACDWLGQIPV